MLHTTRERHIRCNPTLAQYIVADDFEPVVVEGPFDKRQLDPPYVREREALVTRGWQRLKEVATLGIPIIEYPLPEVLAQDQIPQHRPQLTLHLQSPGRHNPRHGRFLLTRRSLATKPSTHSTRARSHLAQHCEWLRPHGDVQHPIALPPLNRDPSFWGMATTQFLGAFNDNLFKQLILLLATPTAAELLADTGTDRQSTAMTVFAIPFLLFSGFAGYVADRVSKRTIVVVAKMAEVVIMLLGFIGFWWYESVGFSGMMIVLFLMGTHSAFFRTRQVWHPAGDAPPRRLAQSRTASF